MNKTIYKRDLREIIVLDFDKLKNKEMKYFTSIVKDNYPKNIYIIKDKKPLYFFEPIDIINIYENNLLNMKLEDYLKINKNKKIEYVYNTENPFNIYQKMRRKFDFILVLDANTNDLIGELEYKLISKKFYDITIRDKESGLYNPQFFKILLDKFIQNNEKIGIIYIRIKNLHILEKFYGKNFIDKIIKVSGHKIEYSVRRVDFPFKLENNDFVILSLNNPVSIIVKIKERLQNNLKNIIIDKIKIEYLLTYSHYPEEENNVLTALEKCKYEMNKLSY